MNNDIVPRKPARPTQQPSMRPRPQLASPPPESSAQLPDLPPIEEPEAPVEPKKPRGSRLKWVIVGVVVAIIAAVAAGWLWYASALAPVDESDDSRQRIQIEQGASLSGVLDMLDEKGLIRSQLAASLYARSINASANLKAGNYSLSASESTQEIFEHFVSGTVDEFTITFLPGATLRRLPGETSEQRTDIKSALLNAGYEDAEIEAAFTKDYDHPLLASKPASADLEGYIYGETYNFASSSSVEQILETTFDHYYKILEENSLIEGFESQGLNLHEGITLASIIQREVSSKEDQKQVAQVFFSRLELGMSLGADATFEYAAKKDNVAATPNLDSPYNTRRYTGLPPGPIAMPGLSALEAVADPADGDYLYFVSGDDGVNHFSHTGEEHEAKARQYCKKTCFGL